MANTNPNPASLADLLAPQAVAVEADLERWLVEPGTPDELAEAMRYSVLNGGKRMRPALVRLAAEAVGGSGDDELARRASVAIELVHSYSLVHDDLPAMDNDVLRRGLPTAHVQFGEQMAILVGDALLTRAFGILAETDLPRASRLIAELATGGGAAGMVAGQVADLELCALPDGPDGLAYIHEYKTAALVRSAVRMGAISAGAADAVLAALSEFGRLLGLAFQAVDDVLDATGQAETLGKTPGKDFRGGKRTLVRELGPEEARRKARAFSAQAIDALTPLGASADKLRRLTSLLAERTY